MLEAKKMIYLVTLKKFQLTLGAFQGIDQGIFFNKRLYFSIGGIGNFGCKTI